MRYYFHLRETGGYVVDEEGQELPELEAARREAIKAARSVMAHETMAGNLPISAIIEVKDEVGTKVFDLPFRDAVKLDG